LPVQLFLNNGSPESSLSISLKESCSLVAQYSSHWECNKEFFSDIVGVLHTSQFGAGE
jgi:hypothetical protein